MKTLYIFISACLLFFSVAVASDKLPPYTHVVANVGSDHFFVMLPHGGKGDTPIGKCYEVTKSGEMRLLWTTAGWYAYPNGLLLSADATYAINFPSISNEELAEEKALDISALQIYASGKLLKSYKIRELLIPEKNEPAPPKLYKPIIANNDSSHPIRTVAISARHNRDYQEKIPSSLKDSAEILIVETWLKEKIIIELSSGLIVARWLPETEH